MSKMSQLHANLSDMEQFRNPYPEPCDDDAPPPLCDSCGEPITDGAVRDQGVVTHVDGGCPKPRNVRVESLYGYPDEWVTEATALANLSGHWCGDESAGARFRRTGSACSPHASYTVER